MSTLLERPDRKPRRGKPEKQADRPGSSLTATTEGAKLTAEGHVAYLVDMAKAEALDLMGETKKSLEFVEGHL